MDEPFEETNLGFATFSNYNDCECINKRKEIFSMKHKTWKSKKGCGKRIWMEVKCGVKKALSSCSFLELRNNLRSYPATTQKNERRRENLINVSIVFTFLEFITKKHGTIPICPHLSIPHPSHTGDFLFDFSSFLGLREKSMRKGTMGS